MNRESFTQSSSYAPKLLHTDAFTHRSFHTIIFWTQRPLYTSVFTRRHAYTQTRLHIEVFAKRNLYTEELVHRQVLTQGIFVYTQKFLHREVGKSLHRGHFTQKSLYTRVFAHKSYTEKGFARRCFYTVITCRCFSQTRFYTERLLHRAL